MKNLRHGIELFLLKTLISFFSALPESTAFKYGKILGTVFYHFLGKRKEIAFKNMHLCNIGNSLYERNIILKSCLQNYGISIAEFCRFNHYSQNSFKQKVIIKYLNDVQITYRENKGLLFLSGHFGCWEVLVQALGAHDLEVGIVVRQQHNLQTDSLINSLRENKNISVITAEKSPLKIIKLLKSKKSVAVLLDVYGGKDGYIAEFFGQRVSTISGAAEIAVKMNTPVLIGFSRRLKNGKIFAENLSPMLAGEDDNMKDADQLLNCYHKELERQIRSYPQFWLWTHRRFKGVIEY